MGKRLATVLFGCQMGCVLLGIAISHHRPIGDYLQSQPALRPLVAYQMASSTDLGYGFFSPRVSSGPHVVVTGKDHGRTLFEQDVTEIGGTRETNLRIRDGLYAIYHGTDADSELRLKRAVTASIAASFLNHGRTAPEISVEVSLPRLLTLREARNKRTIMNWETVYHVDYRTALR